MTERLAAFVLGGLAAGVQACACPCVRTDGRPPEAAVGDAARDAGTDAAPPDASSGDASPGTDAVSPDAGPTDCGTAARCDALVALPNPKLDNRGVCDPLNIGCLAVWLCSTPANESLLLSTYGTCITYCQSNISCPSNFGCRYAAGKPGCADTLPDVDFAGPDFVELCDLIESGVIDDIVGATCPPS